MQIEISVTESSNDSEELKEIFHKSGKSHIRERLQTYLTLLREEFSKGMILPKKAEAKPDGMKALTSGFNKKVNMAPVTNTTDAQIGLKIDTTTINLTQKFQCKAVEFYDAMTRIEMVTAFTRGHVKLEPVKGGKFQLFGGNITGTFEELVPHTKIVQRWRYKQWPEGHYSLVTLSIDEKVCTIIIFL